MLTASTWFKHTGINMHLNNTIIPSVRKYKHFEQALSCSSEYVLLSEANIGNLQSHRNSVVKAQSVDLGATRSLKKRTNTND